MTIRITPDEYSTILYKASEVIKGIFNPHKVYFEFDLSYDHREPRKVDGYDIDVYYDGKMIGFFIDAENGLTNWYDK